MYKRQIKYLIKDYELSSIIKHQPESNVIEDVFYLRTLDHKNAGIVSVAPLQSGFYKITLKTKKQTYSDIVKDVSCGEQGLLTPSGWVKKYGNKGVVAQEIFEEILF